MAGGGGGSSGPDILITGFVFFLLPVTGCSMCKRIMPHFQKAATQVRGHIVSKALRCSDLGPGCF